MTRIGTSDGRQRSGTIAARSAAEPHRQVAVAAERAVRSMNAYVEFVKREAARGEGQVSWAAQRGIAAYGTSGPRQAAEGPGVRERLPGRLHDGGGRPLPGQPPADGQPGGCRDGASPLMVMAWLEEHQVEKDKATEERTIQSHSAAWEGLRAGETVCLSPNGIEETGTQHGTRMPPVAAAWARPYTQ